MLLDVQENVKRCMDISLSAAYSTFFKGVEHLPSMYHNMKDSLLLKMKYGHGCIISPYMVDEMDTGSFQFPTQKRSSSARPSKDPRQSSPWSSICVLQSSSLLMIIMKSYQGVFIWPTPFIQISFKNSPD